MRGGGVVGAQPTHATPNGFPIASATPTTRAHSGGLVSMLAVGQRAAPAKAERPASQPGPHAPSMRPSQDSSSPLTQATMA